MDLRVLRITQMALADQCRCWGVMVFDASGIAIGCAALCAFPTELIQSSNPTYVLWRTRVRKLFPRLGQLRVLFCGLPIPAGSTHIRVRDGANASAVIAELDKVMQRLAREAQCSMIVFKEFDQPASSIGQALAAAGYICGGAIPPTHSLAATFADFAAYRNALKSRYRAQVLRSQKKLLDAGFEIVHGRGLDFFREHFDETLHQLYVEVQRRAEQKLELFPHTFFLNMAAALGDEVLLTLIRRNGRNCAFTFAITRGHTHYNMYSGLDYTVSNEGDLYFNLFYQDMDQAFRAGATTLKLGQTSDMFKSRLGTRAQALWFFARCRSNMLTKALHIVSPLAFPKAATIESNDVFSKLN